MPIVYRRNLHRYSAKQKRYQLVHDKGALPHDNLVTFPDESMPEQLEDLVRAVADDKLIRL